MAGVLNKNPTSEITIGTRMSSLPELGPELYKHFGESE
jgi:hypothetical protein